MELVYIEVRCRSLVQLARAIGFHLSCLSYQRKGARTVFFHQLVHRFVTQGKGTVPALFFVVSSQTVLCHTLFPSPRAPALIYWLEN